ncbi:MAG TPA: hypothetical protein VGI35_06245, partial [Steroidobacteraceae bacterium]
SFSLRGTRSKPKSASGSSLISHSLRGAVPQFRPCLTGSRTLARESLAMKCAALQPSFKHLLAICHERCAESASAEAVMRIIATA